MNKKAIILGAGPAGLVTGWLLSKSGWIVEIYEKNKVVGGMCRSWKWKNNILDTGPHIFHTPDKNMWNFWNKNFGHLLIRGEFGQKILMVIILKIYMTIQYHMSQLKILKKIKEIKFTKS